MSLRKFFEAPRIHDGVSFLLRGMVKSAQTAHKKEDGAVTVEDVQRNYGVSYERAVRIASRMNAC